jgi:hypothetical protein
MVLPDCEHEWGSVGQLSAMIWMLSPSLTVGNWQRLSFFHTCPLSSSIAVPPNAPRHVLGAMVSPPQLSEMKHLRPGLDREGGLRAVLKGQGDLHGVCSVRHARRGRGCRGGSSVALSCHR